MTQRTELEALGHRLEVSGADRTRWPAHERLRFAQLIAQSEEARRLVAEAVALDDVLDRAPGFGTDRIAGLVDRIVASAEHEHAADTKSGDTKVVPFERRQSGAAGRAPVRNRGAWQAAALLAASLVVGVFVGNAGSDSLGIQTASSEFESFDPTELVLNGSRSNLLEEDVL